MRIIITEGEFTIEGQGDPGDEALEAAERLARMLNERPLMSPAGLGRHAEACFREGPAHAVLALAELAAHHRCIPAAACGPAGVANALGRIAQAAYGLDAEQVEAMMLPYCEAIGAGQGGERPKPAPHHGVKAQEQEVAS